jgi:hypothetical protein
LNTGGYLEYIFRAAAAQLFGKQVEPGPLPLRMLRNADFQEVSLNVGGRPALRFALAYGFRNIQTLVRSKHHSTPSVGHWSHRTMMYRTWGCAEVVS